MDSNAANFGYNILEATAFPWPSPMIIKHVILTFKIDGDGKLRFWVAEISESDTAEDLAGMSNYAASKVGTHVGSQFRESPLDIKVTQQCWLLIQLDPDKNWQFTPGQVPCTLKEEDLYGRNIQLRHVFSKNGKAIKGAVSDGGCQTIFFGVVQRGPVEGEVKPDPGRCGINLNVEFVQLDGTVAKKLQLIIDPDVPNDGGTTIP